MQSLTRLAFLYLLFLFELSILPNTAPGYWDSRFTTLAGPVSPGVPGLTQDEQGRLLMFGFWPPADQFTAPGIGRWDGVQWERLSQEGIGPHSVVALGGKIYATFAGYGLDGVVREDGRWLQLGDGLNGVVNTLIAHDGGLLAGGQFTASGASQLRKVARWNGASWTPLGAGLPGNVIKLAANEISIFAVWTNAVGAHVSEWASGMWTEIGLVPPNATEPSVRAVLCDAGRFYIGGNFSAISGSPIKNLARWVDGSWRQHGDGNLIGTVQSLSAWRGELQAAGSFSNHVNGVWRPFALATVHDASWSKQMEGLAVEGHAMVAIEDELFVVARPADTPRMRDTRSALFHHNGRDWGMVFNIGNFSSPTGAVAESPEGLLVAAQTGNGSRCPWFWDGKRFIETTMAPRNDGGEVTFAEWGAACVDRTSYAIATLTVFGQPTRHVLMSCQDGVWRQTTPFPSGLSVRTLTAWNGKLVVGGAGVVPAFWWDGAAWQAMPGPTSGVIEDFEEFRGQLYAGGRTSSGNIVRWNGTAWEYPGFNVSAVSDPIVYSLSAAAGKLYIGGKFDNGDPSSPFSKNVIAWNGTGWEAMPGFTDGTVTAVAASDHGTLAAAGFYRYVANLDAGGIALWRNGAWTITGPNVATHNFQPPRHLHWRGRDLFATGRFSYLGAVRARSFGIWHDEGMQIHMTMPQAAEAQLHVTGAAPATFRLEASNDLREWSSLGGSSFGNNRSWRVPMNGAGATIIRAGDAR